MSRPNILLITSDQQHWFTLGCQNPEVSTPNLDRLAARGTLYNRTYCPNPTCTPTRSSMITGQYPSQHGAWSLGTKLPESATTIGQLLQGEGYDCTLVGKAHFQQLRSTSEYSSLESYPIMQDLAFWRDFDEDFYGFNHVELARNHADEAHAGQHYALWMEEKGAKDWRQYFMPPTGTTPPQEHKWNIPEDLHYDRWIAERTMARLDRQKENDQPFFLWASFFDPHPPYLAPEPWDTMYDPSELTVPTLTPGEHDQNPPHFAKTQEENPDFSDMEGEWGSHGCHSHLRAPDDLAKDIAVYYGMISLMDKYIGQILDRLEENGQADNTIIVFTSDHGHFYGHHGLTAKGPFHYEDVIKVPCIVSWPGHFPEGQESDAIQNLADFTPTVLNLLGMTPPRTMTGTDQSALWRGEVDAVTHHTTVEFHHQPEAIHMRTYVDQRYKLTTYYQKDYGELFDLQEDPKEVNNLWADPGSATLKAELMMKLVHAELGKEPMWMPRVALA